MPLEDKPLLDDLFTGNTLPQNTPPPNYDLTESGKNIIPGLAAFKQSGEQMASYTGMDPQDYFSLLSRQSKANPGKNRINDNNLSTTAVMAPLAKRYNAFAIGVDNEDLNAQGQGKLSKIGNDTLKMLGIAGTTFLEGTLGTINGIGRMIGDKRAASFYDNDLNNALNDWTKNLEDKFPNYYTARERDGHWYEPSNLFTANFLFDKVIKNLGFAIGAAASGGVWGAAFKGIGLTGALMRGGTNLEQVAATMETELAAIPQAQRTARALEILQQAGASTMKYTGKALGKGDRFLTAAMGTTGEASIEALNNLNEYRTKLIGEYEATHGYKPTGADLQSINQDAEHVGNYTFGLNTALLTVSNYIQFPRILNSSYKADKALVNGIETQALKQGEKGIISALPQAGFKKYLYSAKNVASLFFNPSEGAEEILQSAISGGTQEYFNRKRSRKDVSIGEDMLLAGLEKANSESGWEEFMIGALSGGIMTSGVMPFSHIPGVKHVLGGESKIKERGWTGYGGEKEEVTHKAISELNKISFQTALTDRLRSVERSLVSQERRTSATRQGDILESKDEEQNYIYEYLSSRIKYGKYDFVKEDIKNAREAASTPEGFEKLVLEGKVPETDTQADYLQRINNLEQHAGHIKTLYDNLNLRFGNLVNDKGEKVYSPEVMDKMVFSAAKVKDYDTRIPQLSQRLLESGIAIQPLLEELSTGSLKAESVQETLAQIDKLVGINHDGLEMKESLKENLRDVLELGMRRKQFLKEYRDIQINPDQYTTILNEKGESVTKGGLRKRTTTTEREEEEFRKKFSFDTRTLSDLQDQYGKGEVSQRETLNKILDSEHTTSKEKALAYKLLDQTKSGDVLHLDASHLSRSGNHLAGKVEVNYEASASDYEKGTTPVEASILNALSKKYNLTEDYNASREVDLSKEEEDLKKVKENLASLTLAGKKLITTSGNVSTPDTSSLNAEPEAPKKRIEKLFGSTTAPTKEGNLEERHKREQYFLQNLDTLQRKGKDLRPSIKMMVVTVNNEEALGLKGLADHLNPGKNNTDPQEGVIATVYVEKLKTKTYFINESGERLQEVGKPADINTVVVSTLTTKELNWSAQYGGKERYYGADEATAKAYSDAWQKRRESLLSLTSTTEYHDFNLSRGIPIINEKKEGKYERNPVVGTLLPAGAEKLLDTVGDLVQVSTTGTIEMNGETVSVPQGVPFFKYRSTLEFLNNRLFSRDEAAIVLEVMKRITTAITNKQDWEKERKYLQNVAFFGKSEKGLVSNNIFFEGPSWHLGKKSDTEAALSIPFTADALERNREAILNTLQGMFQNVNNHTLTTLKNAPFEELYLDGSELKTRTWKSYQHYLLSEKSPEGTSRNVPLTTNVRKRSDAVANDRNYSYKYAYAPSLLGAVEIEQAPVVAEEEKAPVTEIPKAEKGTHTFTTSTGDTISFSYNGKDVDLTDDSAYQKFLDNLDGRAFSENKSPEELAQAEITAYLQSLSVQEAQTEKLNTVEAKKADIERRRKEELKNNNGSETKDDTYNVKVLLHPGARVRGDKQTFVTREIYEKTYANDTGNNPKVGGAGQTLQRIIERGGYAIEELNSLLPNWRDLLPSSKEINVKYDIELAALKTPAAQPSISSQEDELQRKATERIEKAKKNKPEGDAEYRTADTSRNYAAGAAKKEAAYITEKLGIPVEIVDQLIQKMNGGYAWGKLQDKAITLYNGMESGTGYHEAFEAVWKLFTGDKEKAKYLKEFRSREGKFTDFETGKNLLYKEATDHQAKEQMAEEFRAYVLSDQAPPKPKTNFIGRFFENLKNWIKSLFLGDSRNIQHLFERLDTGYYKNATPYTLESGTEYRSIPGFDATDSYNIVRGAATKVFQKFAQNGGSFNEFDSGFPNVKALFDEVFEQVQKDLDRGIVEGNEGLALVGEKIELHRKEIEKATIEYLRAFKLIIPQEENDREGEETSYGSASSDSYLQDAFQWDGKRNAPASIRLLFATIAETIWKDNTRESIASVRDSSTYMEQMVNSARLFNQTLQEISSLNTPAEKEDRLRELSKQYPNYRRLIKRLELDKDAPTADDFQLRIKLFNTFSKQRPLALKVVHEDGTSSLRESNDSDAARRLTTDWLDSLKAEGKIVTFKDGVYKLNAGAIGTISTPDEQVALLTKMGIPFTKELRSALKGSDLSSFVNAVQRLQKVLKDGGDKEATTTRTLGVNAVFRTLANMYTKAAGDVPESTFLSLEGKRRTEFVQNNTLSTTINDINNAESLEELQEILPYLNTPYASGSRYVNDETIARAQNSGAPLLQMAYVEGIDDRDNDRIYTTDKLNEAQRLAVEINANLKGYFYTLLPADSTTEWMVKVSPLFNYTDLSREELWKDVTDVMNGYYRTEKELFDNDGKNRILHVVNGSYDSAELTEAEVKKFFSGLATEQGAFLREFRVVKDSPEGTFSFEGLDTDFTDDKAVALNREALTKKQLDNILLLRSINYAINNIELQKLFFGDPAAYGSLDNMLKRYKSFLSPRESSIHSWEDLNTHLNEQYNVSGETALKSSDFGYHAHKDHMDTITLETVLTDTPTLSGEEALPFREAYKSSDSTDAQSYATLPGYREIRIKRGDWNKGAEAQYQWVMASDRQALLQDKKITEAGYSKELQEADKALLKKGNPQSGIFQVLKPVGSGYTTDSDPFLDKTSVFPLSYGTTRNTPLGDHYMAMVKEGLSYAIMDSGRKVGTGKKNAFYNEAGNANTVYEGIIRIPFRYFGIQTETAGTKDTGTVGSQISKLAELNIYSGGVPSDYEGDVQQWLKLTDEEQKAASPRHAAVRHSQEVRKAMVENGYQQLLKKLGIEGDEDGNKTADRKAVKELLQDELFRRETPDNIREALEVDDNGEWKVPLEGLNNYSQIRSILYSYVNKAIAKPTVSGGPKVQVSGQGFHAGGVKVVSKVINGKSVYVSSGLKFYERKDGKVSAMEVLLPAWFSRKFPGKTEQEIMDLINASPDKEDILSGVGFRIPTQEMNSIDSFIVKGFLPAHYGDIIVVPEALTTKAGSDFDVDKLNTYLKNIYVDSKGVIHSVPHFSSREESNTFFTPVFEEQLKATIQKKAELLAAVQNLSYGLEDRDNLIRRYGNLLDMLLEDLDVTDLEDQIMRSLEKLGDKAEQEARKEKFLDRMYTQSLENEYFRSLQTLILHPDNFERLVKPNDASKLKAISENLVKLAPSEFGPKSLQSTVSPLFMSKMRHEFISSKGWVGILAVHATGNALAQKTIVWVKPERLATLTDIQEKADLGNLTVLLPHNQINGVATLSGMKDQGGEYISDKLSRKLDGAVDAAKGAWLSRIIQGTDLVNTFAVMDRLGIPEDVTAYFLNQPIIREFNKAMATKSKDEYRDDIIADIHTAFPIGKETLPTTIDHTSLEDRIKEYYQGNRSLSHKENAEQHLILQQFFMFQAMGKNLQRFNSATAYDTASFTDINYLEHKEQQTQEALTNNVFSSVGNVLNQSFISDIKSWMRKGVNDLTSTLLTFDTPGIRKYIGSTLKELYTSQRGAEAYANAARKLEQSFLTYLIQVSNGSNKRIKELLQAGTTNIVHQLSTLNLKGDIKNNLILQTLKRDAGRSPEATKNVLLFSKAYDVFTSNQYTAAMRELRDNPHTASFYKDLLDVTFLQAGIGIQANSFADIIPNEDYKEKLTAALNSLTNPDILLNFEATDSFYKNQWTNTDIVPRIKQKWREDQYGYPYIKNQVVQPWLKKAGADFGYKVDSRSAAFKSRFITVQRDKTGIKLTKEQKKALRKKGDFSYRETVLLRRVDDENGSPVLQLHNPKNPSFGVFAVYAPVNALGEGSKAQEHYFKIRPTVLENNTYKPSQEVSNEELLKSFRGGENVQKSEPVRSSQIENKDKIETPAAETFKPLSSWKKAGKKEKFSYTSEADGATIEVEGYRIDLEGHPEVKSFIYKRGDGQWIWTSQATGKYFPSNGSRKTIKDVMENGIRLTNKAIKEGNANPLLETLGFTKTSSPDAKEAAIQFLKNQGIIKRKC